MRLRWQQMAFGARLLLGGREFPTGKTQTQTNRLLLLLLGGWEFPTGKHKHKHKHKQAASRWGETTNTN